MMSPIETINYFKSCEIVKPNKVILNEVFKDDSVCLEIEEKDRSAKLKKITLTGFSEVFAFTQDSIPPATSYLFKKHLASATCDAIVFCVIENNPYILVLDLKSSLNGYKENKYKCKSAKNLISYLNDVLIEFTDSDLSEWQIVYCICHLSDPKRETEISYDIKVSNNPNDPVYWKVENAETIPIRKLLNIRLI
ncbi:hypothetical protein [Acinetobacter baumannii]|uniref:hypothetical protein n=1 Tax=Acinetobacter baumannii TaxID=470 RepID=UPI0007658F5A|nr:hypothetical protein [Acinetobacter baumannii]MDV7431368.1 hypothetical protein [Acinetobacter baumannii]